MAEPLQLACPRCGVRMLRTLDTKQNKLHTRRRLECLSCTAKFDHRTPDGEPIENGTFEPIKLRKVTTFKAEPESTTTTTKKRRQA